MDRKRKELKHEKEGREICCAASGCPSKIRWGTRGWTLNWTSVWSEKLRKSFDSCSEVCSSRIEKGLIKKSHLENKP